MQIFIRFLIPATISVCLYLLLIGIIKSNGDEHVKNMGKEHVVLRAPKACLWLGCICVAFSACCMIFAWRANQRDAWLMILFSLFIVLGIVLILERLVWRLDVFMSEDYFLFRTLYFKTYKMQYADCSYKYKKNFLVVKTKAKTIHIDVLTANIDYFWKMINKNRVEVIKSK